MICAETFLILLQKKSEDMVKTICVYCASSTKIAPVYFEQARILGRIIAEQNIRIVNGAGNIGLMGAVSDAALEAGGEVIGVIPQFMVDQGWHHKGLTDMIIVNDMHERKKTMASMSDASIALPGGCGTLEELLEIFTWKQLGLYLNPIVILNTNHYYDPLLAMFDNAVDGNFMRALHKQLWAVAEDPETALQLAQTLPRWDKNIRRIAAI